MAVVSHSYVIFWLILFIIFAVAEASTFNIVSVWFCIGSVCAMAASKAGLSFMIQSAIFAVVSLALFILARPFVKKYLKTEEQPTNADRIIGMTAEVIEKVSYREPGAVKVDGKIWTAKSLKEDMNFEKGSMVMVVRIEGVTVYVK